MLGWFPFAWWAIRAFEDAAVYVAFLAIG